MNILVKFQLPLDDPTSGWLNMTPGHPYSDHLKIKIKGKAEKFFTWKLKIPEKEKKNINFNIQQKYKC